MSKPPIETYGRTLVVLSTRDLMSIDRMTRAAGMSSRAEFIRAVLRGIIADERRDNPAPYVALKGTA